MDKLDILKRDEFVSRLVHLVENISSSKANTCFALNGAWGCGKSFVLDMFEERLSVIQSEETYTDKYFVIRYNSWKYDYYEEPLVAIVATIISEIEEKTKLFPDSERKSKILGMLKSAGVALLSMANTALKEKTGLDGRTAIETIIKGEKDGSATYEKSHEYDVHFGFKKVLNDLSEALQEIAENHTVVLVVDELDRCIPEYAVKVLERLHHLAEGKTNIITIVAVDKKQLCYSIKQLFGFESPEKYLEKFFKFDVKLDCGIVSEKVTEKYAEYMDMFDKDIVPFEEPIEEFIQAIFKKVDIRTQEQLVERAMLAHKLLFKEKKDCSFLCMELLLSVMVCIHNYERRFISSLNVGSKYENAFKVSGTIQDPAFASFLIEKFNKIDFRVFPHGGGPTIYRLPDGKPNLYAAIISTWYHMHKPSQEYTYAIEFGSVYTPIAYNHTELKKFVDMIEFLK